MLTTIRKRLKAVYQDVVLFRVGKYVRAVKPPALPQNPDGKVLIHIGCGACIDKRYINVDTRPGLHIHKITTIEELHTAIGPESADLVYACHILEHIPYAKVPHALKQVHACLKKGGVFRISVPNFPVLIEMYQARKSLGDIMAPLMGGQSYPANFHCTAYDDKYLSSLLLEAGFETTRSWDPRNAEYYSFDDWAGRPFPLYGKDWPISLNIEAVK